MQVPSKTEVKKIVLEVTKDRFNRIELELLYLRKNLRKLEEEVTCLKQFRYEGDKNIK